MKKILLLTLSLVSATCFADHFGYLTNITAIERDAKGYKVKDADVDSLPFNVTIQSSDYQGHANIKGMPFDVPYIKDAVFQLKSLGKYSFTVPWESWDGDATIHIKATRANELISQMDLQDRNGWIKAIGIQNAQTLNINKAQENKSDTRRQPECDVYLTLFIDAKTGYIGIEQPIDRRNCE